MQKLITKNLLIARQLLEYYLKQLTLVHYSCAVRRMSYKMGSVSSFWCHICTCKFMRAYIYQAIFRVGRGAGDNLKYSPVTAKIILLCWENVWKDLKKAI